MKNGFKVMDRDLHTMEPDGLCFENALYRAYTWERSLEFCVDELGEDLWLFATDWPHGDTAWPESVEQVVKRPGLTERAKRKILADNALRLCPRLRATC